MCLACSNYQPHNSVIAVARWLISIATLQSEHNETIPTTLSVLLEKEKT